MTEDDVLRQQVEDVIKILENHLTAWKPSRDETRSLLMCIHRLERGLDGKENVDIGRTLGDWLRA